ncbi:MAG: amino acid ABC transporter substrate-binding protein [Azospirillaceae bacterium]
MPLGRARSPFPAHPPAARRAPARRRALLPAVLTALAVALPSLPAVAQTLERIAESGTLRLGYRTDAPPFSHALPSGEPAGFAVDLCREAIEPIREAAGLEEMAVEYVALGAETRFEAVRDGTVDLHCGPSTHTFSRREIVDFSLPWFVSGASVLFRQAGPDSFEALAGERVGVRSGTTTEEALGNTLEALDITAAVVAVESHEEGLERLASGDIAAYFADRAILLDLASREGAPTGLRLSERHFTVETYGLALARGDADFRLVVDRALARTIDSPRIGELFEAHFGGARPSELLRALYALDRVPE